MPGQITAYTNALLCPTAKYKQFTIKQKADLQKLRKSTTQEMRKRLCLFHLILAQNSGGFKVILRVFN